MTSYFSASSPNSHPLDAGISGFTVVASDYMATTEHPLPPPPPFPTEVSRWAASASAAPFQATRTSPTSECPSYEASSTIQSTPPQLSQSSSSHAIKSASTASNQFELPLHHHPNHRKPFTYHGPNADYTNRKQNRLHHDFKALPKEERQRLVKQEASVSDLLARTVHLRFLPTSMKQSELAAIAAECGTYLRVRICGNSTNNQNWIYGFIEFAATAGADALMQRSGMELPNGAGRPPLRLKCNAAKQPIVDRVFHDADPSTGTPCIFGLGNFASRTLKDALDSYFNLKAKEALQEQEGLIAPPPLPPSATAATVAGMPYSPNGGAEGLPPAPRYTDQRLTAPFSSFANTTARLSPHARAFQPSCTSILAAELLPGVQNIGGHHHPQSYTPGSLALARVISESDGSESATGMTPTGLYEAPNSALANRTATSSSSTTPRIIYGAPPGSLSPALHPQSGAIGSGSPVCIQVPSSAKGGAASHRLSPVALKLPPTVTATTEVKGSQLSITLEQLMQSKSATDGEEVLERGAALVLRAMQQAELFLSSQHGFYDAVGSLRSLVELLDCHEAVTGGPASTGTGDQTAALPQRVTQLRLLANLMMALLYMAKRSFHDALPYIHAIVVCCNALPSTPLRGSQPTQRGATFPDTPASAPAGMLLWGELAIGQTGRAIASNPAATKAGRHDDSDRESGDSDEFEAAEVVRGYNCFDQSANFLQDVLNSIEEDDDEEEENDSASECNASTPAAEAMVLRQRDASFHRYVLNVLVAIGMAMEGVHPEVTRNTYSLAASRARDVLGTPCAILEDCLAAASSSFPSGAATASRGLPAPPRLSEVLFPGHVGPRDITFFPRLFFTTTEALRRDVLQHCSIQSDLFWSRLPPIHCVDCF